MDASEGYGISEEQAKAKILEGLKLLKSKWLRAEGLQILENVPMSVKLLKETDAAIKLTQVFRSSRFADTAHKLYNKWISIAESEMTEYWFEVRDQFLNKTQQRDLDRLQTKFEKELATHSLLQAQEPSVNSSLSGDDETPFTPGRRPYDSSDDGIQLQSILATTSSNRLIGSTTMDDRWFMDAVPKTPQPMDTDSSYEALNNSIFSPQLDPSKRARGRPKKYLDSPLQSMNRTDYLGPSTPKRRKRGRPPLNR